MSSERPSKKAETNYGRFPKVLAVEVEDAFRRLSHLDPEKILELLKRYRNNRNAAIAKGGIHVTDFKGVSDGFSDPTDFENIVYLDQAFQKLHAFRSPGGERHYLSNSVASLFGTQGGRPKVHDQEGIKTEIRAILAAHTGAKKLKGTDIIDLLEKHFLNAKKPIPGKTMISDLIKIVRSESH